jgi:hypothetical protein
MATIYNYSDNFVIDSVEPSVLEQKEADAIIEAESLSDLPEPFKERLVVASTMRQLCILQLENEGMQDKLTAYNKDYDRYWNMAITKSPSNCGNIPLERG